MRIAKLNLAVLDLGKTCLSKSTFISSVKMKTISSIWTGKMLKKNYIVKNNLISEHMCLCSEYFPASWDHTWASSWPRTIFWQPSEALLWHVHSGPGLYVYYHASWLSSPRAVGLFLFNHVCLIIHSCLCLIDWKVTSKHTGLLLVMPRAAQSHLQLDVYSEIIIRIW